MASGDVASSSVFVGNLSFDLTEQDVIDFFSQVGPVKSVRIATDRETGKPRGFGFVEFYDVATSESAVRNLSGTELSNRKIRVVFQTDTPVDTRPRREHMEDDRGGRRPTRNKTVGGDLSYHSSQGMATLLGQQPQPGAPADQITSMLARKTRSDLYEYLAHMQALFKQNPQQARDILVQNPQFTRALFQIEIILGMVANPLGDIAPKGIAPPELGGSRYAEEHAYQQPPAYPYQPPAAPGGMGPMVSAAAPVDPRLGGGAPVPVDPRLGAAPRPMVSVAAAAPPPQAGAPPGGPINPEQQALLNQVMSLTPAQIELLPPQQKAQVLALQQQLGR